MAGLFSQLYWPKLLKYLPRLLLHTFNDKYISVCVCVCLALDFIAACPAHFSHSLFLHLCGTKGKIILKTGLLRYEQTLPCVLFSPVFIIAAKAAETEAENHVGSQARGGGCKSLRHNGTHCVAGAPTSQENFMPFVSIVLVFMPEILLFSGTI